MCDILHFKPISSKRASPLGVPPHAFGYPSQEGLLRLSSFILQLIFLSPKLQRGCKRIRLSSFTSLFCVLKNSDYLRRFIYAESDSKRKNTAEIQTNTEPMKKPNAMRFPEAEKTASVMGKIFKNISIYTPENIAWRIFPEMYGKSERLYPETVCIT